MKKAPALSFVVLLLSTTAARAADPTGPEILARVDHAQNAFTDAIFESRLFVREPGGAAREFGFITYQKVPEKRLVRFTAPGDVKGMGVLIENRETMYVYLPGFQKIRRMGTHVKNQTFMGSDFSFEDMSQTTYSPMYEAKLVGQDDKTWQLDMTVKPGIDTEFPKLKMWVDKSCSQPTRIEYYDNAGKKLKTQERTEYYKDSPEHFQPKHIIITDHRRNEHVSQIDFTGTKINSGLKDDLFTQRSLIRGN
jgi:outer membrane lipoprotein-sorting protein